MSYFLGLDIGTSGAKCVLMDETPRLVASAGQEYPILTPRPGWAEQDPETWVAAGTGFVDLDIGSLGGHQFLITDLLDLGAD